MNSPVSQIIKQLVTFDKTIVQPLYIQVAQQIVNAIQRGYLDKGSKLPGTRILSQLLNIHRNTAVAIYEELASQGWVDIIANKGTFVLVPEETTAKIKAAMARARQVRIRMYFSFFLPRDSREALRRKVVAAQSTMRKRRRQK